MKGEEGQDVFKVPCFTNSYFFNSMGEKDHGDNAREKDEGIVFQTHV